MATTRPGGVYRGVDGKLHDAHGKLIEEAPVTVETPTPEEVLLVQDHKDPSSTEPLSATDVTPKPKGKKAKP